jgi:enoyl-CoA hydratase/carnithine racemase
VDKVVLSNKLEDEAEALAQRVRKYPQKALKCAKQAINFRTQVPLEAGLKKETDLFALLFSTREAKEKIDAFFSKRNKKRGDR